MVERQVCPFHSSESYAGTPANDEAGTIVFVCPLTKGHPADGPWTWGYVPPPPGLPGIGDVAISFGLDTALPKTVASFSNRWVEYGVVEEAYARDNPADFAALVERYNHRALAGEGKLSYSVSMFLASTLSRLTTQGSVALKFGPATGPWSYLSVVSYWAMPPARDWEDRLTAEAAGQSFDYLP